MRCNICNKDCPDGEIKIEKVHGRIQFSPCAECRNIIQRTVLLKELEDEQETTVPMWDLE